jgi:hypothetical protein
VTRATIFEPWHDDFLAEHYATMGGTWCAAELGMTVSQVTNRAYRLRTQATRGRDGHLALCRAPALTPLISEWRVVPGALDRYEELTA